jgi:hypothetical protein
VVAAILGRLKLKLVQADGRSVRAKKIRVGLAILATAIGLLAVFAPGAWAWHGEFHGSVTNEGAAPISFEIHASPELDPALIHLTYRSTSCGSITAGVMRVQGRGAAMREASGFGEFFWGGVDNHVRLIVELSRHGDHVSAKGHFYVTRRGCSYDPFYFHATAAAIGLP